MYWARHDLSFWATQGWGRRVVGWWYISRAGAGLYVPEFTPQRFPVRRGHRGHLLVVFEGQRWRGYHCCVSVLSSLGRHLCCHTWLAWGQSRVCKCPSSPAAPSASWLQDGCVFSSGTKDITLPTKVCLVKAVVFPGVMYGCESWTIKKAECWKIDAFGLWCWRRLLRVPWTARRSN